MFAAQMENYEFLVGCRWRKFNMTATAPTNRIVAQRISIRCGKDTIGDLLFTKGEVWDASAKATDDTAIKIVDETGERMVGKKVMTHGKLVTGCVKKVRRYMVKNMGMTRREANVVILLVMNRYTKSDHIFGSFMYVGKKFNFTDPEFDEACADERKRA